MSEIVNIKHRYGSDNIIFKAGAARPYRTTFAGRSYKTLESARAAIEKHTGEMIQNAADIQNLINETANN